MAMTEGLPEKKNGEDLPPPRQEAFENGLLEFQRMGAERDALARDLAKARTDLAGARVVIEALQSQVSNAESRMTSAFIENDETKARNAALETVLSSIMSLGRTFQISHVPVIKTVEEEDEVPTIGGA